MCSKPTLFIIAAALVSTLPVQAESSTSAPSFKKGSGFYLGINAGYTWASSDAQVIASIISANDYLFESDIAMVQSNGNFKFHPNAVIGGLQAGYNKCFSSNILIGLETDFGAFALSESKSVDLTYPEALLSTFTIYQQIYTQWLYTLRPRLGYVYHRTLFFLTGGLSLTDFHYEETFSDNYYSFYPYFPGANAYQSVSKRKIAVGWAIGAGLEFLALQNLSLYLSYLYSNFGSISCQDLLQVEYGGEIYINPFQDHANLDAQIIRIGINWQI